MFFIVGKEIRLTGTLLRFDQSRCSVDADNQTACDLRVQGPAVARLLHPQDALDPRHHFVRRRIRRFVQVNKTGSGREIKKWFTLKHRNISSLASASRRN